MGVHFPFVAWLTDAMVLPVGDPVPQDKLIHPRIEPEIVFLMGERLEGPGVTCAQAMGAVESVWGGAEVIDSRYQDFRFTAGDVAADNASSGAFVTGPIGLPPAELDLALEAVLVEVGGVVVDSATGAAVQGHPGRGARARGQRPVPPWPRHRGRLDRAHRRHDGCRVLAARVEHRAALHQPRLGLPQRREGLTCPSSRSPWRRAARPVQLRTLISALTHAASEAVDAPVESIRVVIREVPLTHWGAGDVTIAERRGAPDPRDTA